jgi:hypothetical protein
MMFSLDDGNQDIDRLLQLAAAINHPIVEVTKVFQLPLGSIQATAQFFSLFGGAAL